MVKDSKADGVAVSEVVGYVIIAGIILTSISIAYVNGYPALQDAREQERLRSVESAFSVMSDNLQEISVGDSTRRRTEMNLIGDTLGIDPNRKSWIHVSITNDSGTELCNRGCNVSIDPVVYQNSAIGLTSPRNPGPASSQTQISRVVYENGAVIRESGNGSGMEVKPDWVFEESGVILNIIATRGDNTVTGDGTFSVVAEQQTTDSLVEVDEEESELNVTVTVGTEAPTAWELYMRSHDAVDGVSTSGDEVTMEINEVKKVIRSKTTVDTEAR